MAVINVLILKKNTKYPQLKQQSIQPTLCKTSLFSTKNIRQKRNEILRCTAQVFFPHILFVHYKLLQNRNKKWHPNHPNQTMWHNSGVSTGLARQQTSKNTYYLKQNTHKHTIHVPFPLCCHTTKLALWGEYEPDCVPELPQFVLVSFLWNFKHTGEDLPN